MRSLRLVVRTLASHAGDRGSNPLGSAITDEEQGMLIALASFLISKQPEILPPPGPAPFQGDADPDQMTGILLFLFRIRIPGQYTSGRCSPARFAHMP